jgi:osmotically-inducible protein OsmY
MSTIVSRQRLKLHDRLLSDQILDILRATGYPGLRRVDCRVTDGVVTVSGEVPSFYFKQFVQATVQRISQVRGIENQLRVSMKWIRGTSKSSDSPMRATG